MSTNSAWRSSLDEEKNALTRERFARQRSPEQGYVLRDPFCMEHTFDSEGSTSSCSPTFGKKRQASKESPSPYRVQAPSLPGAALDQSFAYLPVSWLVEWEAKQEKLLRQHQENTKELVRSLRKDMLRRFNEGKSPKTLAAVLTNIDKVSLQCGAPTKLVRTPSHESEKRSYVLRGGNSANSVLSEIHPAQSAPKCRLAEPPRLAEPQIQAMTSQTSTNRESAIVSSVGKASTPLNTELLRLFASASDSREQGARASTPPFMTGTRSKRAQPTRPKASRVRGCVFDFVHSRIFNGWASLMIALYSFAVGIMADLEMNTAQCGQETIWWLWYVDLAFATFFTIEVLLRVASDGRLYFTGAGRNWNIFDVAVAVVGLADLGWFLETNLGFVRVLRACRALRVLRVLRQFHALKDLRLMAESICSCGISLLWAILLMGSFQYVITVVLVRGASDSVREGQLDADVARVMKEDFGSIARGFFSLTEAISGGRSWGEFAKPFMEVNPVYSCIFPLYVVFVVFGAVNILTGVFVESTSSIANYDKELAVEEELCRAESAINQIRDFFEELDTDSSGTLSFAELTNCLADERVRAYFSVLQMDVHDAHALFQLLDKDGTGDICIKEFIEECLKLRGTAKALDLAAIMRESRVLRQHLKQDMKALAQTLESRIDEIRHQLPPTAES